MKNKEKEESLQKKTKKEKKRTFKTNKKFCKLKRSRNPLRRRYRPRNGNVANFNYFYYYYFFLARSFVNHCSHLIMNTTKLQSSE